MMDQTQLISVLRFSIQLFISEGIFLIGIPRREHFLPRLCMSLAGYAAAAAGYYFFLKIFPGSFPVPYILLWIGLFLLSLCVIAACFELYPSELLFVGVGGYATEHTAFSIAKIIQYMTGWYEDEIGTVPEYLLFRLFPYVIVAYCMYYVVVRKNNKQGEIGEKDIRLIQLALVILFTAVVLSGLTDTESVVGERGILRDVICPLYSIVCAILVIMIEVYFSRENRLTRERETVEQMLQMSYAQQKSSKNAIDIINIKCHDLKHQMGMLTKIDNDQERDQYIDEMRQAISIYDATYHTGCESLDYILREKNLLCDEYGISFSCMADGEAINFLHAPDIYALFGNILDNAVESACKEREPEKRLISLRITRQGEMVYIHVENTCTEKPEFADGLPVTTKKDKEQHGYGVRSIRYIVKKYQGEVLMQAREGKFYLDILIPE